MATEVQLIARKRSQAELGSAASRRLRRDGWVPATMYGRGRDPESLAVSARELRRALGTDAGFNALITLDFEGGDDELTLAREVQLNPVRDTFEHLDFILISRTEKVSAEVPIILVDEATGVTDEGGILEQARYSLSVEALPTSVPDNIEVSVADLGLGESMNVADLAVPEGVEVVTDPEASLVSVVAPAAEEVPEVEELEEGEEVEGEELEEGEEVEGEAEEGESD